MTSNEQTRRSFVLAGLGGALLPVRAQTAPALPAAADHARLRRKRMVFLSLLGGNDGLNTVVPFRDPLYARLRGELALPTRDLLPITPTLALHGQLGALRAMYEAGEVAVLQDVAYPRVDLSHFFSTDVWYSGGLRSVDHDRGWFDRAWELHAAAFAAANLDAGAVLATPAGGLARGDNVPTFDIAQLRRTGIGRREQPATPDPDSLKSSGALMRMHAQRNALSEAVAFRIERRVANRQGPLYGVRQDRLTEQVRVCLWLMASGVNCPVYKLEQGGYDMHSQQLVRHAALLSDLDRALRLAREQLVAEGLWKDTLIVLHSEFGRRVGKNGYDGTDHGTAGPVFLIGGQVAGGLYGKPADLGDLDDDGNLKHSIDFRSVYGGILQDLWGLDPTGLWPEAPKPLSAAKA